MNTRRDKLKNPFPGLRPFESDEAHLFFGRDGQSGQLLGKLSRTKLVAVVGTSGSGKSSLVRAGLLPALRGGITVAGSDWRVAVMRPGSDPMGNLSRALVADLQKGPSAQQEDYELYPAICETILRRSSSGLIEAKQWLKSAEETAPTNLLVVVDQFEELFRYKQEAADRQTKDVAAEFVKLLLKATEQAEASIYIILTMRSEYLGDCAQFLGLPEAINRGQYLIPRMTRKERRAAIEGPVGVCQGQITPFLVNRLLNDAGDDPENLPVLQHALMRTWDKWQRSGKQAVDLEHYYATGGMKEAISRHGDEVYESLSTPRDREVAANLFTALVERDAKGRDVRRPTPLGTLCQIIYGRSNGNKSEKELSAVAAEVIPIINIFRSYGVSFLTPPPTTLLDETKIETVIDISHESLINGWKKLHDWANQEAISARIYRRLAETAALHEDGQAGFYKGRDLKIASDWNENFGPTRAWAVRYHPAYSQALDFLRKSKRQRITTIVLIYLIAITTVVSGLLYIGALRSKSRAEELAKDSNNTPASDPQARLRLAAEAVRTYLTSSTVEALRNALFEHSRRVTIPPVRKGSAVYRVVHAALSPNGKFVVTVNGDMKAHVWQFDTEYRVPSQVDVIEPNIGFLTSVAFDSTGQRIILTGGDKKAVVWNIDKETGRSAGKLIELIGHTETVNRAAFSSDGKYAVTASSDGTARIWKLIDGNAKEVAVLKHSPRGVQTEGAVYVKSAVFSPVNDQCVLTANWDGTVRLWLWNENTGEIKESVEDLHRKGVNNAVFSPDGKYILSASNDGSSIVREGDSSTGKFGALISIFGHDKPVLDAAFNPKDSHNVITASADNALRVWQWDEPSGRQIKSSNTEGGQNSLPLPTTVNAQLRDTLHVYEDWATGVSFDLGGTYILTTGYDGTAAVWRDILKQEKIERYLQTYSEPVFTIDVSKDGSQFLTGSSDRSVRLWEFATGREVAGPLPIDGEVRDAVFNSDNSMAVGLSASGTVYLLNLNGGPEPRHLGSAIAGAQRVATSPDGKYIVASGGGEEVNGWYHPTPNEYFKIALLKAGSEVNSVGFSPDGRYIITGSSDGQIRSWVLPGGSVITMANGESDQTSSAPLISTYKILMQGASVLDAVFSPDGKLIAAVHDDGSIEIIDFNSGQTLHHMTGYKGSTPLPVFKVVFSRDGKYLATAGYDRQEGEYSAGTSHDEKVIVWEVSTGKRLAEVVETTEDQDFINNVRQANNTPLIDPSNSRQRLLYDIAFSNDNSYIIAARGDNRPVHIYSWAYFKDPTELLNVADEILSR